MNTYIFFVYGEFEDHDDVQFFTMNVLGEYKSINSLRYVVEDTNKNLIIIFDSESDKKGIIGMLEELVNHVETIKFYFIFELKDLTAAKISEDIKNLIFKPKDKSISTDLNPNQPKLELDEILEKIANSGIESLTPIEKIFLDNFEK